MQYFVRLGLMISHFFHSSLLIIRGITLVTSWLQQGWNQLSQKLREWALLVSISITLVIF